MKTEAKSAHFNSLLVPGIAKGKSKEGCHRKNLLIPAFCYCNRTTKWDLRLKGWRTFETIAWSMQPKHKGVRSCFCDISPPLMLSPADTCRHSLPSSLLKTLIYLRNRSCKKDRCAQCLFSITSFWQPGVSQSVSHAFSFPTALSIYKIGTFFLKKYSLSNSLPG